MLPEASRHGCLLLAVAGCVGAATYGQQPVPVQSQIFGIEYAVNQDALPLDSVQLWYTLDRGDSWHQYGFDEDRQSPITFHAPTEGLYGFFLIAANSTGPSSAAPTKGTGPHQWVFVDFTPPVVQLHDLRLSRIVGERVVQIRWTAIDPHLVTRPVEVFYQKVPDGPWRPITPDPLANTGRYDWRIPANLVGPVRVRVTVRDESGHHVDSESEVMELPAPLEDHASMGAAAAVESEAASAVTVAGEAGTRAFRLLSIGRSHRERGEIRQAIGRMREAVKADPSLAAAFAEMAAMLYRIGDNDRALDAYEIALEQQPMMRSALQGAAMVHRRKNEYGTAADLLQRILRHNPNDAEIWMNLGDIAVFQGDEIRARGAYQRAVGVDPNATEVIADAHKRLALMAEVSRTYRQGNK